MRGVSYQWREIVNGIPKDLPLNSLPNVGFIAQEVEEYFPQAISESVDGTKLVNYSILIAAITEALQQQNRLLVSKGIEISKLEDMVREKGLL